MSNKVRYKLVDRQLQNKLDQLSDVCKFTEQLPIWYKRAIATANNDHMLVFPVQFGMPNDWGHQFVAYFKRSDVIEYPTDQWLNFPQHQPDEGEFVVVKQKSGKTKISFFLYKDKCANIPDSADRCWFATYDHVNGGIEPLIDQWDDPVIEFKFDCYNNE